MRYLGNAVVLSPSSPGYRCIIALIGDVGAFSSSRDVIVSHTGWSEGYDRPACTLGTHPSDETRFLGEATETVIQRVLIDQYPVYLDMSQQHLRSDQTSVQLRRSAKALVTAGRRVLLIKEQHDDGTPFWTLPGGGVHPDESDTDALTRELTEELHCDVSVGERLTSTWYAHTSSAKLSLYVIYDCELLSTPLPNLSDGIYASRWVNWDTIAPRTLPQIRFALEDIDSF